MRQPVRPRLQGLGRTSAEASTRRHPREDPTQGADVAAPTRGTDAGARRSSVDAAMVGRNDARRRPPMAALWHQSAFVDGVVYETGHGWPPYVTNQPSWTDRVEWCTKPATDGRDTSPTHLPGPVGHGPRRPAGQLLPGYRRSPGARPSAISKVRVSPPRSVSQRWSNPIVTPGRSEDAALTLRQSWLRCTRSWCPR